MQDKGTITWPKLPYYTKSMPTTMLSNIYIPIGLVNEARYQVVGIILDENSMSNL